MRESRTTEQKLELARALFERRELGRSGLEAVKVAYPGVPEEMAATAAHHLYTDGCGAALDFLVDAELCLRESGRRPDYGIASHLLYHMYNWQQFEALLPEGRQDLLDLAAELKEFVDDGDWESVRRSVAELNDVVGGQKNPPEVS